MNSQACHHQEMEQRVRRFDGECEMAITRIRNLKDQARSFLDQLSGEPRELKNRFLRCMKQLDEFMYHITEFNLTASNLENTGSMPKAHKTQQTPKSNRQGKTRPRSDTWRSAETKDSRTQRLKNENCRENRCCSSDSSRTRSIKKNDINGNREAVMTDADSFPHDVFLHRKADDCQPLGLPPQLKLDPATVSKATIISVNGGQLWLLVDDDLFPNIVQEMYEYYSNQKINQEYIPESVCAYYDEADTNYFLRAIYIQSEDDPEVFLVDTGEFQPAIRSRLRPLHPRFCFTPPLAHLCCLADVDQTEDESLEDRQTEFLTQFLGQSFKIKLKMNDSEDDSSNPVPVYLYLDDGTTVNELLVQALASNKSELKEKALLNNIPSTPDENENILQATESTHKVILDENERLDQMDSIRSAEKIINIDDELDNSKCPEYVNAVEAVTGYSNRDEMDICKHYTEGEGCFKGHRCKKRHVMIHPDGWTLDRVSVAGRCRAAPPPAPGARRRARVTHVDGACRLYVHFQQPEEPMSLADLVDEMTRAAADSKSLQLEPAPGELVSARFSDGRHYRARVLAAGDRHSEVSLVSGRGQPELVSARFSDGRHYRARVLAAGDRHSEVMYIDYGNTATVPHAALRPLAPRWLAAPARAARCRLAGLCGERAAPGVADVSAAQVLKQLTLDKTMEAHIIARDFEELSVKLVDDDGFDIAEQLAAFAGLKLKPYKVDDDSQRLCQIVPA